MKWNVRRAAVLGAGTMGSRIAAHLANCGIPTCLLDLVPTQLAPEEKKKGLELSSLVVRNRIARTGLEAAQKGRFPAFFLDEMVALVTVGNFEDHLGWVAEADWIIEAVAEDLEIKRSLLERAARFRRPGTVISTNTSGLPVARIAAGFPEEFRRHWLGTHFFNPPRYLHLLEVIPGPDTSPDVIEAVSQFADVRLGKGVVRAKDTPNFIGNRIGTLALSTVLRLTLEEGLTVEEVDQLTGPTLGWPRSATFGMLDLVGLDVLASVMRNLVSNAPSDEAREVFLLPPFVEKMLTRGLLGAKSGSGFYKRSRSASGDTEVLALNLESLEYRPQKKAQFPSLEMARNIEDTGQRVRALVQSDDRAGRFLWKTLSRTLLYAARRIPEIADRILEIDRAMRWGFGWELGPFELWDAIGLEDSVRRMEKEGYAVPENIATMLSSGARQFYAQTNGVTQYFDFGRVGYEPVDPPPGVLLLRGGLKSLPVIRKAADASLLDLGDGVACVEFHSKRNTLGPEIIAMVNFGLEELAKNFAALVIGNQGTDFSAGANLLLLLMEIQAEEWEEIDRIVRDFQQMNLAIKYASKPVVVAPFRMTLGGGCEMALAAPCAQAGAETYMGLVETAVGLVPGGGGAKEMLLRMMEGLPPGADPLPALRELFRTISMARVSGSAAEARRMGFLRAADSVTMNPDRLLADAKATALEMARSGYRPAHPGPRSDLQVLGEGALAELKIGIHIARRGGFITDYDSVVASKLASILCGGTITGPALVSEQYLLDLEREAFLSLCGEANTQARIEHLLKTGKPL